MFLVRDVGHPATEPIVFVFCSSDHRSCSVDHQRTQINITAFTDAKQPMFITRTVLFGRDADRCSSLFGAATYSTKISGHDDYRFVLDSIRYKVDSIEKELEEEMARILEANPDAQL